MLLYVFVVVSMCILLFIFYYATKKENLLIPEIERASQKEMESGNTLINVTNGGDDIYLPRKGLSLKDKKSNVSFVTPTVYGTDSTISRVYNHIVDKFGTTWRGIDKPNKIISTIPTINELIARQKNH